MKTYELMDMLIIIPIIIGIGWVTSGMEPMEDSGKTNAAILMILIMYLILGVIPRWIDKMHDIGLKNTLRLIAIIGGLFLILAAMEILMPGSLEDKETPYLAVAILGITMMTYSVARYIYKKHTDHYIGPDRRNEE